MNLFWAKTLFSRHSHAAEWQNSVKIAVSPRKVSVRIFESPQAPIKYSPKYRGGHLLDVTNSRDELTSSMADFNGRPQPLKTRIYISAASYLHPRDLHPR